MKPPRHPAGPTRRELLLGALTAPLVAALGSTRSRLDRRALVGRHNVVLTRPDIRSPLQVGNGEFSFTADITGLQTFAREYESGMPLGTMAQWAWHRFPPPDGLDLDDIYTEYESHGRKIPYADGKGGFATDAAPATPHPAVWRRANPHRMDLGRIGFTLTSPAARPATLADIESPRQELDLWTGTLTSRFSFAGQPVVVTTVCHPDQDTLGLRVRSPLVASGQLAIVLTFPYPAGEWKRTMDASAADSRHHTRVSHTANGAVFTREVDATRYYTAARWSDGAALQLSEGHRFEFKASGTETLELALTFSPNEVGDAPFVETVHTAAAEGWERFWTEGGAIDFGASSDERAPELERRIVLSQYVTAVNCAGSMPPQETGLVTNSWYGKHHLEMHWWHGAHFALWGRPHLLARSMDWYHRILPEARDLARRQGYAGARWPKQVGPDGRESPSAVAVFLVWQQPHPIYLAELLYRATGDPAVLERHAELVFASADFMASFAAWDARTGRYVLGPPLIPAQETYGAIRERVVNPTFELAYWSWGLSVAQTWRQRLGQPRERAWDRVRVHLARPTVRRGVYAAIEVEPFTERTDHPSMLGALGFVPPTPLVDAAVMRRTLDDVRREWNWETTWGWDYPLMAMTAARVGDPAAAVDLLLMDAPKNIYLPNGHNFQTARLPLYLPGNGGLLYAAAMMAGGWDGSRGHAPGFPDNGQWDVSVEDLQRAP